jgi:hypothetical protein
VNLDSNIHAFDHNTNKCIYLGSLLLCTTGDVQLYDYVFGEWKCVFIIYVVVEMQSHFWHNVNRLFQVESKCYIGYICYF